MRFPKLLLILIPVLLLGSCALWPFGKKEPMNCMDDNSCDTSNPFEEALVGGTWYCYGNARDEPWDCSQDKDPSKVKDIETVSSTSAPTSTPTPDTREPDLGTRVELALNEEVISHQNDAAEKNSGANALPLADDGSTPGAIEADKLFEYAEGSFAVQLIALQTVEEIERFAALHDIDSPLYVNIESQGSDWYVLLLGIYGNQPQANAAASVWQTTHNPSSKPWVRPLGPLRAAAERAKAVGG